MLQQILVYVIVSFAACYALWTLSGGKLRQGLLRFLQRTVPPLAGPLTRRQRDLETAKGCSSCRSAKA